MTLDPYSFTAPSRVKALLVPLDKIRRSTFYQYADRLLTAREVRLVDVSSDDEAAMFSPLGYPNGKVIFDYSLSEDDPDDFALYDIEPFRQTFVVIGVVSYKDCPKDMEYYESLLDRFKKRYSNAILHKVLVFGITNKDTIIGSKHVIPVYSSTVQYTSLETVMCDITSEFLTQLSYYTIARQLGSFKSPMIKELDRPSSPTTAATENQNASSTTHIQSSQSLLSVNSDHNIASSKSGSISLGINDRSKSKQRGRVVKFTGNMYLLAGHVTEALKQFVEAANILKSAYDYIWYASALDGIAVCLVLLSFLEVPVTIPPVALNSKSVHLSNPSHQGDSSPLGMSPTSTPPPTASNNHQESRHSFTGKSKNAGLGVLSRHSSSSSLPMTSQPHLQDFIPDLVDNIIRQYSRGQDSEAVPHIVSAELYLRTLKLFVFIRIGGGWNGATLSAIVRGTPLHKNVTAQSTSKTVISTWANRLYSTDISSLTLPNQCRIYSGLSSIYAAADMPRKHAFVVRELLLVLNSYTREVNKTLAKHQSSSTIGETASQKGADHSEASNALNYLSILDSVSDKGILGLLEEVSKIYAAGDLEAVGCGWNSLKLSFLKTATLICESSGAYSGVVHYVTTILRTSSDCLTKEEQLKLFASIHRSIELYRQQGHGDLAGQYFDPYMLRSIARSDDTMTSSLVRKELNTSLKKDDNVFLHNPYAQPPKAEFSHDKLIVQNERTDFIVRLQNPFEFEVEVLELELLAVEDEKNPGGIGLEASVKNFFLPPTHVSEITVPLITKTPGKLAIYGCKVHVRNYAPKIYHLTEKLVPQLEDKIKAVGCTSALTVSKWQMEHTKEYTLTFDVLPELPTLALKELSLNQGSAMLLEGESQEFVISLSNFSNVSANLIEVSFYDSTMEAIQDVLIKRDISPSETYECEYFLYKRNAFELSPTSTQEVGPHQTGEFVIRLMGKRGLLNGVITFSYGHISQTNDKVVWTRVLNVPVNVTVNPTIELGGCDVIRLPNSPVMKLNDTDHSSLSHFLENLEGKPEDYCLLILDFRNSWTEPVEVELWSKKPSDLSSQVASVKGTIIPQTTKRFLLPMKWDGLSPLALNQPIPSLTNRQFVLTNQAKKDVAKNAREAFWYREEILRLIEGQWSVLKSGKKGNVELRGLRITQKILNVLRVEEVKMSMSLIENDNGSSISQTGSYWKVPLEYEGGMLRTTVVNMSNTAIKGVLRLIPSLRSSEPGENDGLGKKLLYNGWLQQPVRNILPGEAIDVDLGIVYICRGEYQWTSVFDVITEDGKQVHGQKVPLFIEVS